MLREDAELTEERMVVVRTPGMARRVLSRRVKSGAEVRP